MQALAGAGGMGTLARHGGRDILAAPVPVLGAELMAATDSAFDSGTGGWVVYGTNTKTNESGRLRITYVDNANGAYSDYLQVARGTVVSTPVVNTWYVLSVDLKISTGSLTAQFWDGAQILSLPAVSGAGMTNILLGWRCNATGNYLKTPLLGATGYVEVDNVSLKSLTISSLISARAYASANSDISARVTRIAGTQVGLISRLDNPANPANFLICYETGAGRVKVDKCLAGVYSGVIDGPVTYVAGQRPRLLCSGNNVSAYYNGVQVGTTQVVADAAIVNNKYHGLFNTYAGNVLADYRNAAV